ncbi:MAG: ATP-binding protein [Saprospiraceae bacterium]
MLTFLRWWILLFTFFFLQTLSAQKTDIQFRRLSIEDGLADNLVHDILMDSKGMVWLATHDGLSRYDGHHFKNYKVDKNNPNGLEGSVLMNIKEGENGVYWLACNGIGLIKFDSKTETFTSFRHNPQNPNSLSADGTTKIFIDENKEIWIGTFSGGLNHFDPETGIFKSYAMKENFEVSNSFMMNSVQDIIDDPLDKNKLWLATHEGIRHFDKTTGEITTYLLMDSYPTFSVSLLGEENGDIWIGTEGHGLVKFNSQTQQVDFPTEPMQVKKVTYKSPHEIWVATIGKGLGIYHTKNKTWEYLTDKDSKSFAILSDNIYGVFQDKDDRLWVRDMTLGVSVSNGSGSIFSQPEMDDAVQQTLNHFKKVTSLPLFNAFLIASADNSRLFIFKKNKEGYVHSKTPILPLEPGETGKILDMLTTSDQQTFVLVKTPTAIRLFKYASIENTFEEILIPEFEKINVAKEGFATMKEDHNEKIWFAFSSGKLMEWDYESVVERSIGSFITKEIGPQIWDIIFDKKNDLWAASLTDGVCRLNLKTNKEDYFSYKDGWFKGWRILSLAELRNGKIWVGTSASGIYELDPDNLSKENVINFDQKNGMPDDKINGMLVDDFGNVWINTTRGLVKYYAEYQHFTQFGKENGLENTFLNYGLEQLANNDLIIGQPFAFSILKPKNTIDYDDPHQVYFSALEVNGEEYSTEQNLNVLDRLVLQREENYFKLKFSANYYDDQDKVSYRYILENYDRDWTTVKGGEAEAYFTNVPAGKYKFKVTGVNREGNKNSETTELNIVIRPYWYGRTFMKIFYILASIGLLVFFWKAQRRRYILNAELEMEKNEATRLKELDGIKSRFFTDVSHELRTPLTLILGPITSLLKSKDLTNQQFTLLKLAQQNGKDILKLIGSILDLSKMESGKLALENRPIALFPFIRRTVTNFESHAERSNIQFSFQYKIPQELHVELDKSKLEIVLNNLISNALKFTEAEGSVLFLAEDLENVFQFSIKDSGRGIHKKDLPHVFDRFYQSQQLGALTEGGTGIGLAVSQEYIKLMGGKIWVESEIGKGSTFFIQIPRKEILGTTTASIESPGELSFPKEIAVPLISNDKKAWSEEQATLMVVEDNYELRNYLETILSPHFNILVAENGQVALDQILKISRNNDVTIRLPDLILSDVMMPMMDGFQLLQELRSNTEMDHIPMVMLTARADMEDRLNALRIGVDDYLLKPFDEEELLIRINNLLKNYAVRKSIQANSEEAKKAKNDVLKKNAIAEEDQAWLENLEKVILEFLSDSRFNMDFLGDQMSMSRRQLQRKVKKLVGLTPKEYINEVRLHEARKLLETGKVKMVKSAAFKVGYTDPQYFSAQFKDRFGKVPSAYLE